MYVPKVMLLESYLHCATVRLIVCFSYFSSNGIFYL